MYSFSFLLSIKSYLIKKGLSLPTRDVKVFHSSTHRVVFAQTKLLVPIWQPCGCEFVSQTVCIWGHASAPTWLSLCSPYACVGFLRVLQVPPTRQRHAGKFTGSCPNWTYYGVCMTLDFELPEGRYWCPPELHPLKAQFLDICYFWVVWGYLDMTALE